MPHLGAAEERHAHSDLWERSTVHLGRLNICWSVWFDGRAWWQPEKPAAFEALSMLS
jgi:hypothetical protein